MQLAYIVTNNYREDELHPGLVYSVLILYNWHNNFTIGVISDRIVSRTRYFELIDCIE